MKNLLFVFLTLAIIAITSMAVMGQGIAPELPVGPKQAPIDGGLTLLALAGGGYAIKKLRESPSE